jgi:predicted nucleic acid-binding protein
VSRIVLLDNEAVQALGDRAHRRHRRVLDQLETAGIRTVRGFPIEVAVPTTIRVEAGWDRDSSSWAFVNQLPVADIPLSSKHADAAASLRRRTGVSVADAHLGAAIQHVAQDRITVITSDPGDMRTVAQDRRVDIVGI